MSDDARDFPALTLNLKDGDVRERVEHMPTPEQRAQRHREERG